MIQSKFRKAFNQVGLLIGEQLQIRQTINVKVSFKPLGPTCVANENVSSSDYCTMKPTISLSKSVNIGIKY